MSVLTVFDIIVSSVSLEQVTSSEIVQKFNPFPYFSESDSRYSCLG